MIPIALFPLLHAVWWELLEIAQLLPWYAWIAVTLIMAFGAYIFTLGVLVSAWAGYTFFASALGLHDSAPFHRAAIAAHQKELDRLVSLKRE
jgi:hypothetical protein